MSNDITPDAKECPLLLARRIIFGKYKLSIIWFLSKNESMRFGKLKDAFLDPGLTQKMLTQHLRELEDDKIIERKVYNEMSVRVEYSLSEIGKKFVPIMNSMECWAEEYITYMEKANGS